MREWVKECGRGEGRGLIPHAQRRREEKEGKEEGLEEVLTKVKE